MSVWEQDEFDILRTSHALSDAELAKRLRSRSIGAICVVRSGLHLFHEGRDASMLSQMMVDTLRENQEKNTCPRCGKVY